MSLLPHFRPIPPGTLRHEVFERIRYMDIAVTPMQVSEAMGYVGLKGRWKQNQVRNLMAAMVSTGHLKKLGPKLYKRWDNRHEYRQISLKAALAEYIEERGRVEFKQLVAHFEEHHTKGSIRVTLYRLQTEETVEKIEHNWVWRGNVIALDSACS